MNSSLVRRWRNADAIILAAVYGKRANTVLSRPARKTGCLRECQAAGRRDSHSPPACSLGSVHPVWDSFRSQVSL